MKLYLKTGLIVIVLTGFLFYPIYTKLSIVHSQNHFVNQVKITPSPEHTNLSTSSSKSSAYGEPLLLLLVGLALFIAASTIKKRGNNHSIEIERK